MVPAAFIVELSGACRRRPEGEGAVSRAGGESGEDAAVKFLRRRGYEIVERNYRGSRYEVDIIAREGEILAFVEVKTRAAGKSRSGAEAVNQRKRRRIAQAAQHYLMTHPEAQSFVCRFDVVLLEAEAGKKPKAGELLRDAFR